MFTKNILLDWVDSLLQYGESILPAPSTASFDLPKYLSFRDRSLRFLAAAFGNESREYYKFDSIVNNPTKRYVEIGCELLRGVRDDIENDRISIIGILSANIFSDLLTMSEHLFENDFFPASAVLAGSVLEENLRQLCLKHSIPINGTKPDGKIVPRSASDLNNALRSKNVYDEVSRSNVDALYKIRNKAAHPPNDVTKEEVLRLINGVNDFINKYRL